MTNIIQGITGFAGTMLAMPPSVMLVGFDTAKPILNALGLLSGIYIVAANRKSVNKKEFLKIVAVMSLGMLAGFALRSVLAGRERVMYIMLGAVVILTAVSGIYKTFLKKRRRAQPRKSRVRRSAYCGGSDARIVRLRRSASRLVYDGQGQ